MRLGFNLHIVILCIVHRQYTNIDCVTTASRIRCLPLMQGKVDYCLFTALHTLKDWIRLEYMAAFIFRNYVVHDNACLFLFLDFREEHNFSGSSDSTKGGCALFI